MKIVCNKVTSRIVNETSKKLSKNIAVREDLPVKHFRITTATSYVCSWSYHFLWRTNIKRHFILPLAHRLPLEYVLLNQFRWVQRHILITSFERKTQDIFGYAAISFQTHQRQSCVFQHHNRHSIMHQLFREKVNDTKNSFNTFTLNMRWRHAVVISLLNHDRISSLNKLSLTKMSEYFGTRPLYTACIWWFL